MTYFRAVGTEGVDVGIGGVGAVTNVDVARGRVDVDTVGVGESLADVLKNGGGLKGAGIDTVEIGSGMPLSIVGGVIEVYVVVVDVEVGGGNGEGCLLSGGDVDDEGGGGLVAVITGAGDDETVGVEGFDFARVETYGYLFCLGERVEIDNGDGAVVYGIAVGIILPSIAYV